MTVLQGSLEELVDRVAEPTPARLASLHDEVLRLRRSVEDLEALSAAEAAQLTLVRQPADLAAIIADAVAALRSQLQAAGLSVASDLERAVVVADRARLDQVTRNLLTNALKFTPAGGQVMVTVAADGSWATLTVSDTGPGIPHEERAHVFERFWRGRNAAGVGGSGVGLAVVAELVRAHDGEVEVQAGAGGGATFVVRLPLAPPRDASGRRRQ